MGLLGFLLVIHTLVLILLIAKSEKQRKLHVEFSNNEISYDNIDVIIAAKEDVAVICRCLKSVTDAGFKKIILCLDGCDGSVYLEILKSFPDITLLENRDCVGKISAQMQCLARSFSDNILVLDADVSIRKESIKSFVGTFLTKKTDFLCPYSKGVFEGTYFFLGKVIECDRIMRQRIVRAGMDAYGVSNLSGYCIMADRRKYTDIIAANVIQDDIVASINLLKQGYIVNTYHDIVCDEIERGSLVSYFFQKIRWTAGNILLLRLYPSFFRTVCFEKAVVFSFSFVMWYFALWVDFFALMLSFVNPILTYFLLIECLVKFIALIRIDKEGGNYVYKAAYVCLWPIFSFFCLFMSPFYIAGQLRDSCTRR